MSATAKLVRSDESQSRPSSVFPLPATTSDQVETLLIVNDNPMVRDLEAQFLLLQGYALLEAEGAVDALRVARETTAIHLLIPDFSMPQSDGLDLTRRFRSMDPIHRAFCMIC